MTAVTHPRDCGVVTAIRYFFLNGEFKFLDPHVLQRMRCSCLFRWKNLEFSNSLQEGISHNTKVYKDPKHRPSFNDSSSFRTVFDCFQKGLGYFACIAGQGSRGGRCKDMQSI